VNLGAVERRAGSTWLVAEAKRIQDEIDALQAELAATAERIAADPS
jgi:hypothetical protein